MWLSWLQLAQAARLPQSRPPRCRLLAPRRHRPPPARLQAPPRLLVLAPVPRLPGAPAYRGVGEAGAPIRRSAEPLNPKSSSAVLQAVPQWVGQPSLHEEHGPGSHSRSAGADHRLAAAFTPQAAGPHCCLSTADSFRAGARSKQAAEARGWAHRHKLVLHKGQVEVGFGLEGVTAGGFHLAPLGRGRGGAAGLGRGML